MLDYWQVSYASRLEPRPTLGPTQPPIQKVPVVLSQNVKRPARATDLSSLPNAEPMNLSSYTPPPPPPYHTGTSTL